MLHGVELLLLFRANVTVFSLWVEYDYFGGLVAHIWNLGAQMHVAVRNLSLDCVAWLCANGASTTVADATNQGFTPMHLACKGIRPEDEADRIAICDMLYTHGAEHCMNQVALAGGDTEDTPVGSATCLPSCNRQHVASSVTFSAGVFACSRVLVWISTCVDGGYSSVLLHFATPSSCANGSCGTVLHWMIALSQTRTEHG